MSKYTNNNTLTVHGRAWTRGKKTAETTATDVKKAVSRFDLNVVRVGGCLTEGQREFVPGRRTKHAKSESQQ